MLEGVLSSIIATVVVGTALYLHRQGFLLEWWAALAESIPRKAVREPDVRHTVRRFRHQLIRRLLKDQSRQGIHRGQFGKSTSHFESSKYQTNPEDLALKPRMYLTFWPGVILSSHGLARPAVCLAINGVQQLFHNNRILVGQAISREMLPQKQPEMVSIRHTICGALFLYHELGWNPISRGVVDLMLDDRNGWQNQDGGWAHSDREITSSDLWGSAYALRLLEIVTCHGSQFTPSESYRASRAKMATLDYLKSAWQTTKWSYGGASSEENAVSLFIEVADVLRKADAPFHAVILESLRSWLSPRGSLCESYLNSCRDLHPTQLFARMSYAFFRAGERRDVWAPLFEAAVSLQGENLISAEMAFVLDLSYAYEQKL